jgi:hypothetical protein
VKKVCSTTASKRRPASSSERFVNAVNVIGMCSSKDGSSMRSGNDPAGPEWPAIISPRQRRRMRPDEVLDLVVGDLRQAVHGEHERDAAPRPSENRPPVSLCIVIAYAAVTIGWRVF